MAISKYKTNNTVATNKNNKIMGKIQSADSLRVERKVDEKKNKRCLLRKFKFKNVDNVFMAEMCV
jgi:hypothetical protein